MRIGTHQQYLVLQELIARAQGRVADLQVRLADGKRIRQPSDDPLGTLDVLSFRRAKAVTLSHSANAEGGIRSMKLAENALSGMDEILKRARVLVTQGANTPTTQEARNAMAAEIRTLRQRLVGLANSQDGFGRYLFAGTEVNTKPFEETGDPPVLGYLGDNGKLLLDVGPGTVMEGNVLLDQQVIAAHAALYDAEQRLLSGDVAGLSGVTLQLLQDAGEGINLLRGEVGQRQKQFESAQQIAQRRADDLTKSISDKEDADMAQVVTDLASAQSAYQAALSSFALVGRLSLLDFLR